MNQATTTATASIARAIRAARQGRGAPERRPPPITRSGIWAVVPDDDTLFHYRFEWICSLTDLGVVASLEKRRFVDGDVRIFSIDFDRPGHDRAPADRRGRPSRARDRGPRRDGADP